MADTEKPEQFDAWLAEANAGLLEELDRVVDVEAGLADVKRRAAEKPRPYPTPTRLQLARDIKAGQVKHFHFLVPWTGRIYDDRNVTARTAELVAAELADYGAPEPYEESLTSGTRNYSIVSLTPAGEEWLNTYGSTE